MHSVRFDIPNVLMIFAQDEEKRYVPLSHDDPGALTLLQKQRGDRLRRGDRVTA